MASETLSATPGRGTALIVDDEPSNCRLLSQMLRREGFNPREAYDGFQALELFAQEPADIVFMDVMMPHMDGFETTRRLKQLTGARFVPVIFLTALRDEQSLVQCVEAGGDDFLSKPFSFSILKARIQAMERVRDLQRALAAKNDALAELIEQDREEQALAERIFTRAINVNNVAPAGLTLVQRPAALFSGDLVLTEYLPDGGLRILLGDFTGHGLAAAIGALPVAELFHELTRAGCDDRRLLVEINRKLYRMLPADRFMAAMLVSVAPHGQELTWWNGGLPSAWLRRADALQELPSHALPLGILPELPGDDSPRRVRVTAGDRLLLFTDGLPEALDRSGQMFADGAFGALLAAWAPGTAIVPALLDGWSRHQAGAEQRDDLALIELELGPALSAETALTAAHPGGWRWMLELEGARLGNLAPLDDILRPLGVLSGLESHLGALQTIVSELYANALEHGVLQLDSRMKATPEGFEAYYRERARRLAAGWPGRIMLQLGYEPLSEGGGRMHIIVRDSGSGFSERDLPGPVGDPVRPWGRGLALVRELCESLRYGHHGSEVHAVYRVS